MTSAEPPTLFLSYARGDAQDVAERLFTDLTEKRGYRLWQDRARIRAGWAWDEEIREGLAGSRLVVALLSPYAVRRAGAPGNPDNRDSVCLDEIAYARGAAGVPVLPVMVRSCEPPFLLFRYQYVDLRDVGAASKPPLYRKRFEDLCSTVDAVLASGRVAERDWDASRLPSPFDFSPYLAERGRDFTGRGWLFEELESWCADPGGGPALLITGDPGIGKSAIVAQLAHLNPRARVLAYYCCRADVRDTLRPSAFVRSLVGMLGARIEGYLEVLRGLKLLDQMGEPEVARDPVSAFERLILRPLSDLPPQDPSPQLLVVDALDEALGAEAGTGIVELLRSCLEMLPRSIRMVATSRGDPSVLTRLAALSRRRLDAHDHRNRDDVRRYIELRLQRRPPPADAPGPPVDAAALARKIATFSDGSFLVSRTLLDALERGLLPLDALAELDKVARRTPGVVPPALISLYDRFFERSFGAASGDYAAVQTLLSIMVAAREPLEGAELAAVANLDRRRFQTMMDRLAVFVPTREGRREFFHKSFADWLTGVGEDQRPLAGAWAVDGNEGERLIANWCARIVRSDPASAPPYVLAHAADHLASAGRNSELRTLLVNPAWMRTRLQKTGAGALVRDYEFARGDAALRLLGAVLRSASHVLEGDRTQLEPQLLARLPDQDEPDLRRLRDDLRRSLKGPRLEPLFPSIFSPGLVSVLDIAGYRVEAACVSPDSREFVALLSSLKDGGAFIRRWDISTGMLVHQSAEFDAVYPAESHFALSQDRRRALAGDRIIDAETGRTVCSLQFPAGSGGDPRESWFCEEDRVVSVLLDWAAPRRGPASTLLRLEVETGKLLEKRLAGTLEGLHVLHVDGPTDRVVGLDAQGDMELRELSSGSVLDRVALGLDIEVVESLTASADGKHVVIRCRDGALLVRDPDTGAALRTTERVSGIAPSCALRSIGAFLVSWGSNDARVWDTRDLGIWPEWDQHHDWVRSIAISADADWLATVSLDTMARVWDVNTGRVVRTFDGSEGSAGSTGAIAVLPDGHRFLTGDRGHWLRQFDRTKGLEWSWRSELPCVNAIAATRDGARAVIAGHDRSLVVDLAGRKVRAFQGNSRGYVVALTPDESTALIGAGDLARSDQEDVESGVIQAWSLKTRRPTYRLQGHRGPVTGIAVCQGPGDGRAVSCSGDRTLIVWDLKTHRALRVLSGHTGRVRGVAVTPDGKRAVSASSDRTLRVWDLAAGREIARFWGDAQFTACAVSPDGRRVVVGDEHGRVLMLELH